MRAKKTFPGYVQLNALLDSLGGWVIDYYRECQTKGFTPSPEQFKSMLSIKRGKKVDQSKPNSLFAFIESLIKERSESPDYSTSTVQDYRQALRTLKEFAQFRDQLDFEDIDLSFFFAFTGWLYSQGQSRNYVAKIIRRLKTFLNDATERGINTNLTFRSRKFSVTEVRTEQIYLTIEELAQIYHTENLPARLDRVRDVFLLGCFTGLRFQDLSTIKEEHFFEKDGVDMIRIKTKKSNKTTEVIIPLHPIARAIIKKYDGKAPKAISNQKTNDYLKELCEIAGVNSPIVVVEYPGGKPVEKTYPKYLKVHTHTARSTAATNMLDAGIPLEVVQKILGHKNIATTLRYDRRGKEHAAKIVAASNFFNAQAFLRKVD